MKIAILTFEGFNELDSFIALGILNRIKGEGWEVQITSPTDSVTSMNGVTIQAQQPLEYCDDSDVVLFGSGIYTREVAKDKAILERINLNTEKQLVGSQCSGALLMAKLKLLNNLPACTDLTTKPWVIEAGVKVLNQSFVAKNNIATAGGCMSSQYLATWVIAKLAGIDAAENALSYVSPVGEQQQFVEKSLSVIQPYL
ncbi:DJ-1/PfpI family protein [Cocleimonas flava]|uniref:DJ-1/PfpI family protein n=1 Tax=Cocleimonas flava TaxID=634765 RepID=A0A4R1F542_9GAMM|nr:DJ-1/PfpI family protein [Cocleimonas flava]TCJ87792.1 DJ-1/PfpI family protein [Cocleimonas flava]